MTDTDRDARLKNKEMMEKYRPFQSIGRSLSPEFEKLSAELLFLIREHGINKIKPEQGNKEQFKEFATAVHEGWKLAQQKIIEEIILRLESIGTLESRKKEQHQNKQKDEKEQTIREINRAKREILVLRRFIDSIVWTMLKFEHSTIRRLPLKGGVDNLSIASILQAKDVIDEMNTDGGTIAISSDITTFVHTGDILRLSLNDGFKFIELKSGKKNIEFSEAAQFSHEVKCPHFDEAFTKDFNDTDKKHYSRTKKQLERAKAIVETIETGKGIDQFYNAPLTIEETSLSPEFYSEAIVKCREEITEDKPWSITVVDSCLYIGVYSKAEMGFVGFNAWMDGMECKSPIYNLTDSFQDALSRPLPSLDLPTKLLEEILNGSIIIVVCLDYRAFFNFANKLYPGLFFLSKPDEKITRMVEDFKIDGQFITCNTNNGKMFLGGGLITRMIFDLHRPKNIIEMQYRSSELFDDSAIKQARKAARDKKKKKKSQSKIRKLSKKQNRT
ncbi:hypothetical protein V2J91_07095 [Pseudomonas alliivorans]|nr:hypothetical protein [Pseudomonas alliivorans]